VSGEREVAVADTRAWWWASDIGPQQGESVRDYCTRADLVRSVLSAPDEAVWEESRSVWWTLWHSLPKGGLVILPGDTERVEVDLKVWAAPGVDVARLLQGVEISLPRHDAGDAEGTAVVRDDFAVRVFARTDADGHEKRTQHARFAVVLALYLALLGLLCWRSIRDGEQRGALRADLAACTDALADAGAEVDAAHARGFVDGRLAGLAEAADIRRAAEKAMRALDSDESYPDHDDIGDCPICPRCRR
jgi:hypothetical protein